MRKLWAILLLFLSSLVAAQSSPIDSLKKKLYFAKDSSRVDCLNSLSLEYWHNAQMDSARKFANTALAEAQKINYIKGTATAYQVLGRLEFYLATNFSAAENYLTLSLTLFKQIPDDNELGGAWRCLGVSKWVLCKFDEAAEAFEVATQFYAKTGDAKNLEEAYHVMSLMELERGYYSRSLQYAVKSGQLSGKGDDQKLGRFYMVLGDYETVLEYGRKMPLNKAGVQFRYLYMGNVFCALKQFDSARHYFRLYSKTIQNAGQDKCKLYTGLGRLHLALKQYDTAAVYLNDALALAMKSNDCNEVMRILVELARSYQGKGDVEKTRETTEALFAMAQQAGARQHLRDAHFLLYQLDIQLKKEKAALAHLQQYTLLKEAIDKDLSTDKLTFYKIKAQKEKDEYKIKLLNEEKKLQQQRLSQTAWQRNILIGGVAVLCLIGAILLRTISLKRRNEKYMRELAENSMQIQTLENQKQLAELEMQALRAQMNPHFIFNCLSSINNFILKNDTEMASDYLTKFSRLIRLVLNNSKELLVALAEELEMLQLYLELERQRFKNSFDFNIVVAKEIDPSALHIPPLLLQPFVENAIWHGLLHKKDKGLLEIKLWLAKDMLNCSIKDNGIGRSMAEQLKTQSVQKQKSLGMYITKERLALLNRNLEQASVRMEDVMGENGEIAGTKVVLHIRYQTKAESDI